MFKNCLSHLTPGLFVVALVSASGSLLWAQRPNILSIDDSPDATAKEKGRVVKIAPDDSDTSSNSPRASQITPIPPATRFWIGLAGRPLNNRLLREHLQLPAGQGLVVERIVPDSPADKAGLQPRDILLVASGRPIGDVSDLVELIGEGKGAQLQLEFLRAGVTMTAAVEPVERPVDYTVGRPQGPIGRLGDPVDEDQVEEWFRNHFGGRLGGTPFPMRPHGRLFGAPGLNMEELPNGVSVQIQRENDGPTKITVRRGNDSWVIEGDDPRALEELPAELRPFVESMLGTSEFQLMPGQRHPFHEMLPGLDGSGGGPLGGRLMDRLDGMEQSIEELRERLLGRPSLEEEPTP